MVAKSGKGRTCVIIYNDEYNKIVHKFLNPLNAELNHICPLLASFGSHHILHVSRIRVNENNFQKLQKDPTDKYQKTYHQNPTT